MAIAIVVLSSVLGIFFNHVSSSSFVIPTPFSKRPYEFTIGFRKTYWILLILLAITIIAIYHRNFNLGLVCLMGLYLVCFTYHSSQDPIFYVWIHAQTPRQFLKQKIKTGLYYILFLSLFIAIPLAFSAPDAIYQIVIVMLLGSLYIVLIIVSAYSNYPAQSTLSHKFQIIGSFIFPPFLLFTIPNFYMQALHRLNPYLK